MRVSVRQGAGTGCLMKIGMRTEGGGAGRGEGGGGGEGGAAGAAGRVGEECWRIGRSNEGIWTDRGWWSEAY